MRYWQLRFAWVFLALPSLVVPDASARTWHIEADGTGDAPTIQAGIDSAATGDTVAVHPGTYFENLAINDKDLVLRGLSGAEATVVDGGGHGRVLTWFGAGVLEGFTIRGGWMEIGGGIHLTGLGPAVIRQNIIEDNAARGGGGVFLDVVARSDIVIESNVVRNNWSESDGGGMLIANAADGVPKVYVRDNLIEGNHVEDGLGGGIRSFNSHVTDNIIIRNFAAMSGGGAACAARGEFARNTVAYNNTINLTLNGAGVTVSGSSVVVRNNLVVSNHGSPITPSRSRHSLRFGRSPLQSRLG
ncbi:MAG: nitrous oxide reductase family maturation protein NosD [Candidatus Krumholzibacteriia bacterium]